MLRVYDKRLELQSRGREDAESYGVRWEMEFKQDRAQACAKALLTLDSEDWRAFLVGVLRSYVDFRETTREAESYEKYRAPLLAWWEGLTEGFRRCRLVVERIQQRLDDVVAWFANALSPMLAVVVACRGDQFLTEMIYAGTKRWNQKHYALLKQRKKVVTPYVLHLKPRTWRGVLSVPVQERKAAGAWGEFRKGAVVCDLQGLSIRNFSMLPKVRLAGRGVWVRRRADPRVFSQQEGRTMQVKAEGAVQGYVERRSREGKVFRSVDLYVKGKDPGVLRLGIPEDQMPLIEACKQAEGKQARASIEVRKFEQTGRVFFDLSALGSVEVTAEGGRPVDLTIILVAVLLLAFLTGLGVGRL
jgi:hypothetical protein